MYVIHVNLLKIFLICKNMGLTSTRLYITKKGSFCLNFSIITDILVWKTNHSSLFIENLSINVECVNNRGGEISGGS